MGYPLSFHSSFPVFASENEGVVVSPDLNSQVWTFFGCWGLLCSGLCFYRGLGVPVSRRKQIWQLIYLFRVLFSLDVFYMASCLLMLLCIPGTSFFLSVVYFVLLQRKICDTSFWSVLLCGVVRCGVLCFWDHLYLDGQFWIFGERRYRSHLVLRFGLFGWLTLFPFSR